MYKFLLAIALSFILSTSANAEQNTDPSQNKTQNIKVLAFSHDSKDEVSTANVLAGKNEFLVTKIQTISDGKLLYPVPVVRIGNENYVVIQSIKDLAALEDKTDKDTILDSKDGNFDKLYAASFVGTGDNQQIKVTKLSEEAKAILIKNKRFAIRDKIIRADRIIRVVRAGKVVSLKTRMVVICEPNRCRSH